MGHPNEKGQIIQRQRQQAKNKEKAQERKREKDRSRENKHKTPVWSSKLITLTLGTKFNAGIFINMW